MVEKDEGIACGGASNVVAEWDNGRTKDHGGGSEERDQAGDAEDQVPVGMHTPPPVIYIWLAHMSQM